jgi:hypothetical protein
VAIPLSRREGSAKGQKEGTKVQNWYLFLFGVWFFDQSPTFQIYGIQIIGRGFTS